MPIEVLEMLIKVSLSEESDNKNEKASPEDPNKMPFDKDSFMEEVMEQVMAYLDHKTER